MLAEAVADMNVKFFSRNNSPGSVCSRFILLQRTIEYPGTVATAAVAAAACLCTRRLC